MIEDLSDPIIHLIRNAVDHGVEETQERLANGKPEKSIVRLEARQEGGPIVILVADDGRGMNAEKLRAKAVEKASSPMRKPTPWTSARATTWCSSPVSPWPARCRTCPATVAWAWTWCAPTSRSSTAPSTSARAWARAPPSSSACRSPWRSCRCCWCVSAISPSPCPCRWSAILPIEPAEVQEVGVAPPWSCGAKSCRSCRSRPAGLGAEPDARIRRARAERRAELHPAIDSFAGREDAVIKSLDDFRPKGVAGVTTLSNGQIVLILDMKELLGAMGDTCGVPSGAPRPPRTAGPRGLIAGVRTT